MGSEASSWGRGVKGRKEGGWEVWGTKKVGTGGWEVGGVKGAEGWGFLDAMGREEYGVGPVGWEVGHVKRVEHYRLP